MTRTRLGVQVLRADVPNENNRMYPMTALERCVEVGKAGPILGMLGAPSGINVVDMSMVSHVVQNLRIEGEYLLGDIEILRTDKGDILLQLLDAVQIDFRTNGTGTIDVVDGVSVVKDFCLISIDAVYDGAAL